MKSAVNKVIAALNAGGIPAVRGYPGIAMQALTAPRAAVSLGRADGTLIQVLITVLVPAAMGGPACEDTVIQAAVLLQPLGKITINGPCRYDARSDLFSMELATEFGSQEVE